MLVWVVACVCVCESSSTAVPGDTVEISAGQLTLDAYVVLFFLFGAWLRVFYDDRSPLPLIR